jgi:hypothetical protein
MNGRHVSAPRGAGAIQNPAYRPAGIFLIDGLTGQGRRPRRSGGCEESRGMADMGRPYGCAPQADPFPRQQLCNFRLTEPQACLHPILKDLDPQASRQFWR